MFASSVIILKNRFNCSAGLGRGRENAKHLGPAPNKPSGRSDRSARSAFIPDFAGFCGAYKAAAEPQSLAVNLFELVDIEQT